MLNEVDSKRGMMHDEMRAITDSKMSVLVIEQIERLNKWVL